MKSYEEMAKSALERISDYNEASKKRRKTVLKIAVPTASVCIIAVLAVSFLKADLFKSKVSNEKSGEEQVSSDSSEKNTSDDVSDDVSGDGGVKQGTDGKKQTVSTDSQSDKEQQSTSSEENKKSAGIAVSAETVKRKEASQNLCIFWWKNKLKVYPDLHQALEINQGEVLTVTADYRPTAENITDFEYEGKTLLEWAQESENNRMSREMMTQLLKFGDSLKYGDALWSTGTPLGEKWDKEYYDKQVAFIGEELLNKYIVNGEFLREKLEKDISELPDSKYKLAYNTYIEKVMPDAQKQLTENGIKCERPKMPNNSLIIYVTAQQLENLPLNNLKDWYFRLYGDYEDPVSYAEKKIME